MLSQLARTIKMVPKPTKQEHWLLRAQSAVQRSPTVERRQRTDELRSNIVANRSTARSTVWRSVDGNVNPLQPIAGHDDWNPVHQADHSQPD